MAPLGHDATPDLGVHACPPRVQCPDHGVKQAKLSWAETESRFTKLFERFAIDVSQETDTQGAGKILRLSWDEAWGIQERAVARGLARKPHVVPARIGVDEKAAGRGPDYITSAREHLADADQRACSTATSR